VEIIIRPNPRRIRVIRVAYETHDSRTIVMGTARACAATYLGRSFGNVDGCNGLLAYRKWKRYLVEIRIDAPETNIVKSFTKPDDQRPFKNNIFARLAYTVTRRCQTSGALVVVNIFERTNC